MVLRLATARKVSRRLSPDRAAFEIAQRERERLGRELHDGLGQSLAGIAALSAALSRNLTMKADPEGAAAAAEIAALLNQAIAQASDLARGFCQVGRDGAGLADALATLATDVRRRFRVACTLACDRQELRLGEETEAHLLRIAQEAVRNAISHGRADRIDISLTCDDDKGVLSVRDNGAGLPRGAACRGGMGLPSMAFRARAIRGAFGVAPHPLRGTVATCVFPLPRRRRSPGIPDHAGGNR